MLRITTAIRPDGATVALEGRLAGPWVDELRASWRSLATTRDARSIRVDLDAVTFIDTAGKALLWAMHQQGAALTATGCMTRAILDEIGKNAHEHRGRTAVGNGDDRWST
jgi:anti-anti-sigma regulatory factor